MKISRVVRHIYCEFLESRRIIDDEDRWIDFAQRLSPAQFVVWLAAEVTSTMVRDASSEMIIARQSDAERFLKSQYGYFSDRGRIIVVFREVVQHKLKIAK